MPKPDFDAKIRCMHGLNNKNLSEENIVYETQAVRQNLTLSK